MLEQSNKAGSALIFLQGTTKMAANNDQSNQILQSLQTVVSQQQTMLVGQQTIQSRQQAQLDNMQEQLGMLTEVATKLAIMEERRAEDKGRLADLEERFEKVRDRVNERFPQYDTLTETFKAVNSKLWTAIGIAIVGLLLSAAKLGILTT